MKNLIIAIITFSSLNAQAYDMSKTESYDMAYRDNADGSTQYIGGCSTHQEYEGKWFRVTQTLVPYFEPAYQSTTAEMKKRLKNLEPALVEALAKYMGGFEALTNTDDITVEKIISGKLRYMELYRFNIGVGGGNGMYLVFGKSQFNNSARFEIISDVMDGDVEYCDHKAWIK